jgi:hypothetical protein
MFKDEGIHTSKYWRKRGEETRVRRESMHDEIAKATMLKIASTYDQMAKRAAELEGKGISRFANRRDRLT